MSKTELLFAQSYRVLKYENLGLILSDIDYVLLANLKAFSALVPETQNRAIPDLPSPDAKA